MTAKTTLRTWGSSRGIIIPKKVLEAVKWNTSDDLEITVTENEIRIRRPFEHRSFEERLSDYNGKIEVCDFDWGEPVGKEML